MKQDITIIFTAFAILLLHACTQKEKPFEINKADTKNEAKNTYFTTDNNGKPVLCFTEMDSTDSLYRLKYAHFDEKTGLFKRAITVSGSEGTSTAAESMAKIAFKADGTIIAVFSKRFENEKNPFAGAIYYCLSADEGKSWTKAQFLHSDTSHTFGRSFFDLATLKNGEIGAVWLDGRFGKEFKGSALFFASTEKGSGFGNDKCLQKGVCECCRTDILCDEDGNIHVAYRDIEVQEMQKTQVRDMAYILSKDNGRNFTAPKMISNDNWQIEGCPHSGPTLAVKSNRTNAIWFTAGGNPGLYHSNSSALGSDFKPRTLVSSSGKHPQMIGLEDGRLAMVCGESDNDEPAIKMDHSKGMKMDHPKAAGSAKIVLRILNEGKEEKKMAITDGLQADHHAVITSVDGDALIAWTREENGRSSVFYSRVALN